MGSGAAAYLDRGAGYEAGRVADQEIDHGRDFLWLTIPAQRTGQSPLLRNFLHPCAHRGFDQTGCDCINADSMPTKAAAKAFGHVDDCAFDVPYSTTVLPFNPAVDAVVTIDPP
jgi:hypothetical protein